MMKRRRFPVLLWVLAILLSVLLASVAPLWAENGKGHRGFEGCLAQKGGRVLFSDHADSLFTPASVQKLFTSVAALHHLGPDYRIETRVRGFGTLSSGVLRGDLVIDAAADPTWNQTFFEKDPRQPLRDIARGLLAAGVTQVEGDLVIDIGGFPGWDYPPSRPISEMAFGFSAPVSALAIDHNTSRWRIAPGRKLRERASISGIPVGLEVENRSETVGPERDGRGSLEILPQWDSDRIVVRGEFPISERAFALDVSLPNPDRWAGLELYRVLEEEGIEIEGRLRLATGLASLSSASPLYTLESPPLSEILEPILVDSENWYAEMLLRVLARAVKGEGRLDLGVDVLDELMTEVVGSDVGGFSFEDASGLSVENLVTPEAVVDLLQFAWRQSWRGSLVAAMSRPGKGTLESWPVLPGGLAAKTGTLKHTIALAGYLDPEGAMLSGAEPVVFACFFNHRPGPRRAQRVEIGLRLREWSTSTD